MCKRAEPLENSKACTESHLSLTYKMENKGLTLDIRQPLHMPDFGFQLYECRNSRCTLVKQTADADNHRSDIQAQKFLHFCRRMALTTTEPACGSQKTGR